MQHKRQKIQVKVFMDCLDNICSKLKLITMNTFFFMKIRQLVIRRIRIQLPAICESALSEIKTAELSGPQSASSSS